MARIFIEASSFYGKRSGVGRYGLSLSLPLIAARAQDRFVLFNFLRPGRRLNRDFSLPKNARQSHIWWFPGRVFSLLMRRGLSLPLELFGLWRADVLIFPNFIAWASLTRKPRISIVHDIAFEFFPEYIQAKNLAYLRRQLPKSLHRSAAVIAVSEATKRDLVQHYHIAPEKITVVPNAVDTSIFNPTARRQTAAALKRHKLPQTYLLFVGNVEPRKNLEGLLRAYAQSYAEHKLPLVIVGAKGWNDGDIEQLLAELKHLPIYRTDFVDDTSLAALYAGATAFVYPSFYEGFGIPCLEAMACGCPVICSNTSSLPEVVGDAAIQVSPTATGELASSIVRLAKDKPLQKKLARLGVERARKFSWEESASRLSAVISKVLR